MNSSLRYSGISCALHTLLGMDVLIKHGLLLLLKLVGRVYDCFATKSISCMDSIDKPKYR
jgi:hypothetical protein